jgi:hypothetical protein
LIFGHAIYRSQLTKFLSRGGLSTVGVAGIETGEFRPIAVSAEDIGEGMVVEAPIVGQGNVLADLGEWAVICSPSSVASRKRRRDASRAASSSAVKWPR